MHRVRAGMNLPSKVRLDGKWWKLYSVEFKSPDGKFSAYFYALSTEHASYQVEAMRMNGTLCDISTED